MSPSFRRWWGWARSFDDERPTLDGTAFSPIMIAIGGFFWVMRRLSPLEHIKNFLYEREEKKLQLTEDFSNTVGGSIQREVPAWFVDGYLMIEVIVLVILTGTVEFLSEFWRTILGFLIAFNVAQSVQANVHNIVWRGIIGRKIFPPPHSHARNLILSFLAYIEMIWQFGLIYWLLLINGFKGDWQTFGVSETIYFSVITATTIGFGDIVPQLGEAGFRLRATVICEVLVSVMMLSLVIARSLSAFQSHPDKAGARPNK